MPQGGRPVSLLELGPSAGLLLLCDRYRYRFGDRTWGPAAAELELAGELHGAPPAGLLDTRIDVAARTGIDLHPIDVTTEEGRGCSSASSGPTRPSGSTGCAGRSMSCARSRS